MATKKQRENYWRNSRHAAVRNISWLDYENGGYLDSNALYRGKEAMEARERRKTGRRKTDAEIKRQLGRIANRAISLNARDNARANLNTTNYKRLNAAFRSAERMLGYVQG